MRGIAPRYWNILFNIVGYSRPCCVEEASARKKICNSNNHAENASKSGQPCVPLVDCLTHGVNGRVERWVCAPFSGHPCALVVRRGAGSALIGRLFIFCCFFVDFAFGHVLSSSFILVTVGFSVRNGGPFQVFILFSKRSFLLFAVVGFRYLQFVLVASITRFTGRPATQHTYSSQGGNDSPCCPSRLLEEGPHISVPRTTLRILTLD